MTKKNIDFGENKVQHMSETSYPHCLKILQKSTKNPPKMEPKSSQNGVQEGVQEPPETTRNLRALITPFLGGLGRPPRVPRGPKRPPKEPKEAPKELQESPKRLQEAPKSAPGGLKRSPRDPKSRSRWLKTLQDRP